MEFTSKILVDYHITTLLLIIASVFIFLLYKKIKLNSSEILILKYKLNNMLDMNESSNEEKKNNEQIELDILPIELIPSNSEEFKSKLLTTKQATITIYYNNGDSESKIWNAIKIDHTSNVIGNLRSRQEFRNGNWQKKNIAKVKVEVINHNFPISNNSSINHKNSIILDSRIIFEKVYGSIFDDIKNGKIKSVGETQLCIVNNRIGFGGDKRSEKKENLNLLFDHFVNTNKTNVNSFDRNDWHSLIKKLTNGQTKTIDYIYYRDFIQELLNRYNKK